MNQNIKNYYSGSSGDEIKKAHFHKVLALHESPELEWNYLSKEVPLLPRGWFELSRLTSTDRIEFTRDFWLSKLPYKGENAEHVNESIIQFFAQLEEIGIYATQQTCDTPFDVHMVYGMKASRCYFHGSPPASKDSIANLQKQFPKVALPKDYLSFLEIHDGFCKYTDTGILKIREMAKTYLKFQSRLQYLDHENDFHIGISNPQSLIPFYESFGLHCYQCFYGEWVPDDEMGNIYFSEEEKLISDYLDRNNLVENLAFASFLDWLVFYLEDTTF